MSQTLEWWVAYERGTFEVVQAAIAELLDEVDELRERVEDLLEDFG